MLSLPDLTISPVSLAARRCSMTSRVTSDIHGSRVTRRYPRTISVALHETLRRVLHESATCVKTECCAATSPFSPAAKAARFPVYQRHVSSPWTAMLLVSSGAASASLPPADGPTKNSKFPEESAVRERFSPSAD